MKFWHIITFVISILIIACGGGDDNSSSSNADKPAEVVKKDGPNGEKIFRTYCITCHGIDGKLELNGAKDLSLSEVSMEERINQITNGKGLMTPFEGILTEEQIKAVAEYTVTFKEDM